MGEQATLDFNLTFFFSPYFSPFSHQKKKKIEKNMTNAKKNIFHPENEVRSTGTMSLDHSTPDQITFDSAPFGRLT